MFGWILRSATLSVFVLLVLTAAAHAERPKPSVPAGLLYYAKDDPQGSADNSAAVVNPYICGALFQVIWSDVEQRDGEYDWSRLDARMQPWIDGGKKVAIRVMWCTSGSWPRPFYKMPTPQWVWEQGAKFAYQPSNATEIPLPWDPIYQRYAWRFLERLAERYGREPHLLFFDITPGAETNPYRFGPKNRNNTDYKTTYATIAASDGRKYSDELWLDTIFAWVDAAARILPETPLLVTLNVGGLRGPDRSVTIGDFCAAKGIMVGQNGLAGRSFQEIAGGRSAGFVRWKQEVPLFFEMVHQSGGTTGTLLEVMHAAERIQCNFLNVYPNDVLRGTVGTPDYDRQYEDALRYGFDALSHTKRSCSF